MPFATRRIADLKLGRLSAAFLAFVSVSVGAVVAEESVAPAAQSSALVYVDLAAAGIGAALGALHLRGGAEFPLAPKVLLCGELGLYWSGAAESLSLQADLECFARWRPTGPKGASLGAGAGLAVASIAAAPTSEGSSAWNTLGVKALAIAEGGWSLGREASTLMVEPFVRAAFALGPEFSGGQSPGIRQGTTFGTALSGAAGLRLKWSLQ